MTLQTSVSIDMNPSTAGQVVRGTPRTGKNTDTKSLPFGVAVVRDASKPTDLQACKLPTAAADRLAGIVGYQPTAVNHLDDTGIKSGNLFLLLDEGECDVPVEGAVAKGGRAFMRIAPSGDGLRTQLGAIRGDEDLNGATPTAVELKGTEFLTNATAAGQLVRMTVSASANRATQA